MSTADIVQDAVDTPDKKLTRHTLATRINHWLMASSILVLVFTAFLPIQGIKFAWVTIHWIAGLVFTGSIIFHIVYALKFQDWRSMWVEMKEFSDLFSSMAGQIEKLKVSPGKYWLLQKLYHHIISIFSIIVIITGVLMMFKIDSPFWERDPYFLSSETWGIVYVLHGFASLCFIPMVLMHIYFAFRPEKLHYTRSMIKGWITKKEYLAYHDPEKWELEKERKDAGQDKE